MDCSHKQKVFIIIIIFILRYNTPARALLVNYVITIILIVVPPPGAAFDFLVELVGYPTWVFYGISVVGLITMRKSHAHLERPFTTVIITNIPLISSGSLSQFCSY